MADKHCTWTNFYEKFADALLPYRDNRKGLIGKLQDLYGSIGIKFPTLDSSAVPVDIDPYTVFGLFNKGITDENRRKIVKGFADMFGINAGLPRDFAGIPVLNNLNATFYPFIGDSRRGEHDIDNLWDVFEAELALAADDTDANRETFVTAFDRTAQFGSGWKLTMGLYWARPHTFINLDSRNRWFMGDVAGAGAAVAAVVPREKGAPIPDGRRYLAICDAIRSQLGSEECPYTDFPTLSHAAYMESERVNKEQKAAAKASEQEAEENALGDAGVETPHYWLYAPGVGASMWEDFYERGVMGIGWHELGNLRDYPTKADMRLRLQEVYGSGSSQKHSAHAVWQFAHDIKPGDIIFVKQGRTEILGWGAVTGDYEYDADAGRYPNLRKVRWARKGRWTNDGQFAMKTLTDVTDYPDFVAKLNALFEDEEEEGETNVETAAQLAPYGKEDFLAEVYMSEEQYNALVGVLRSKKNVILQGAPGVGKTFIAKRLAYSMMGVKDPERVQMVQFHQSYSYEDFIEGFRPIAEGFKLVKGAFYTFCKKAQDDTENDYFFIIDEINRGNLSKIFGELFMLIENDKRGRNNKLQLLYSHEDFHVPSNVYLIGMMNTADRSLAMLDYALRRRFAFFDLKPGFHSDRFVAYREGLGSAKLNDLLACVERLNEEIAKDETLGDGFCIGHSYFCGMMRHEDVTDAKLETIVEYELVPMLREYWFDEPSKVREWTDALRRSIK